MSEQRRVVRIDHWFNEQVRASRNLPMSSEDPFPRRSLSEDPEPGRGLRAAVWLVLLALVVVLMCMEGKVG